MQKDHPSVVCCFIGAGNGIGRAAASSLGLYALTGILSSASPPCRTTPSWIQIPIAANL